MNLAPLLSRNPVNPRYFADPDGRAVYLTGSHTWNNLQDKGPGDPPAAFDWDFYLDLLVRHNHNFIRLWAWQSIHDGSDNFGGAAPLPWRRTGPGEALDGKPHFDLEQFDPAYFERLRRRVRTAGQRGIYVDVMLFDGWSATVGNSPIIRWNAFAGGNNVNGVDILSNPREKVYTRWVAMDDPEIVRLQELYVRKVVEAVNEFDNVLFEIANEPSGLSHAWQEHFVRFIRNCEAELPKRHMIGTPGGMKTLNKAMFAGSGDFVSPDSQAPDDPRRSDYKSGAITWGEADYDRGDKVVILDTDHLWGIGGNAVWAWRSFVRGYNVLYMDPAKDLPGAFFKGTEQWPAEPNETLRREMGEIRKVSLDVDLNRTLPANALSSTGYCLAEPGQAYIVLQDTGGPFTVQAAPGRYRARWHIIESGETTDEQPVDLTTTPSSFTPPTSAEAVLILLRCQ